MDLEKLLDLSLSSLFDVSRQRAGIRCKGMNFAKPEPFREYDQLLRDLIPKPSIEGLGAVWPSFQIALQDEDDHEHDLIEDDVTLIDIEFAGEDFQAARVQMILVSGEVMYGLDQLIVPDKMKDWMSRFMDDSITFSDCAAGAWGRSEMGAIAGIQSITVAPVFREDAFLAYIIETARLIASLLESDSPAAIAMTVEAASIDRDGRMQPFSPMEGEWFEGAMRRLGARPAPYPDHDFDFGLGHSDQVCREHPMMAFLPRRVVAT